MLCTSSPVLAAIAGELVQVPTAGEGAALACVIGLVWWFARRTATTDKQTLDRIAQLEDDIGELREQLDAQRHDKHEALAANAALRIVLRTVRRLLASGTPDATPLAIALLEEPL